MIMQARQLKQIVALLVAGAVLGGAGTVWASSILAQKVKQFKLDNGLTLLVVARDTSPTFSAYITIGVGSANEDAANRGVAHLLEHMRFKGTHTIGTTNYAAEKPLIAAIDEVAVQLRAAEAMQPPDEKKIAALREQMRKLQQQEHQYIVKDECSQIYARNGGVGFNAFTGKDMTSYMISLPANKLELWVALEADRMKNAVLREFYTEREVVREERRRSYESRPGGMMYEALLATAFRVHPYRHPVIGWDCDIRALTKAKTRDFLHRYYAPTNTVIAVVGDVDAQQVYRLVQRYFGDIAPGEKVPVVSAVEPPQRGERRCEVRFDAQPQLFIAYHKPTLPSRDDYAFDLISEILSDGPGSRLYRELVLKRQLATAVTTFGAPGARYANLFVISATPQPPHTCAELEQAIYTELQRLVDAPVAADELQRAKKRLRADRLRSLRSNDRLANMLTHFQVVAGDWRYLADYDQVVATISAAEIQQAARRWLTSANRTVITLVQEK